MRHALVASVFACVLASAPDARACKCMPRSLADAVAFDDVVAVANVGAVRTEKDGRRSALVTFEDVLRGPHKRPLRVFWTPPDGKSCHLVDLRAGRWLLFLTWQQDGTLAVRSCEGNIQRLAKGAWANRRAELMTHLAVVKSDDEAITAAARAAGPMLVASMLSKPGAEVLTSPVAPDEMVRPERALVEKQKNGTWIVRWSQNPPAGKAIDAEVHVKPDGVTHVVRAEASFSPD